MDTRASKSGSADQWGDLVLVGSYANRLVALTGMVHDVNGSAAAGATVRATPSRGGESFVAVTDDDGQYRLDLPENLYDIVITPPLGSDLGATQHPDRVSLSTDRELDLALEEVVYFSGRVTDADGNGIAGVEIQWNDFSDPTDEGVVFFLRSVHITTAADGSFHTTIAPRLYSFTLTPPVGSGYGSQHPPFVSLLKNRELNFELGRTFRIAGTILDDSGNPGRDLSLHAVDSSTGNFAFGEPAADGTLWGRAQRGPDGDRRRRRLPAPAVAGRL